MMDRWRGYEKQLAIEVVRSLDCAAFFLTMVPRDSERQDSYHNHYHMTLGAATALKPLLESVRQSTGDIQWQPTSPEFADIADRYLLDCGAFAALQRISSLERYGLAHSKFQSEKHLVIEVQGDDGERNEVEAEHWLRYSTDASLDEKKRRLSAIKADIAIKIDRHVRVQEDWFIRYDTSRELTAYHHDWAEIFTAGIPEMRTLPEDVRLGGRKFSDWNRCSVKACSQVLHHVAFCTRSRFTNPTLNLRNLLTTFARREDISTTWQASGESADWANTIISGLTLDEESLTRSAQNFEIPLPYYIEFGQGSVLLPVFGGLLNAGAGLVWHLRRRYADDWDRAVEAREAVFRDDLRTVFSVEKYLIPARGFKLKRGDGSILTDIDAIVLDRQTGAMALVQLKWLDIYGRSISERNSRRLNLLKANEWVDKVHNWIDGRSAKEVAAALGLSSVGEEPPSLIVIARHAAAFSGEKGKDARAIWTSWPNLVRTRSRFPQDDMQPILARLRSVPTPRGIRKNDSRYQFPDLIVDVKEM